MNYPYPQFQRPGNPRRNQPPRRAAAPAPGVPVRVVPGVPARGFSAAGRPVRMRVLRRQSLINRLESSPWLLFLTITALIGLALLPTLVAGGTYSYYMVSGRVLPGVNVGGFAAGDMRQAELEQKLTTDWNRQKTLTLTDGARKWSAAPADLGLSIDANASAARAFQVGRGPKALQEALWLVRFGSVAVDPVVIYDPQAARAGLERLSAKMSQPARNASLKRINGQWTAVPGKNGSVLNVEQTVQRIGAQPREILVNRTVPVVMQPVAPRVADLSPVLDQLRGMMDHPLRVQAYDPITNEMLDVNVPQEEFASWVTTAPKGNGIAIGLDGKRLSAYLNRWKKGLGSDRSLEQFTPPDDLAERWQNGQPVTAIVYHNPTSYTVEAGDTLTRIAFKVGMPYWKIQQANPAINPDQLQAGQTLTIPSKNDMLPLPIVTNKRIVVSISKQHMWTYENGQERSSYVISTGIDRSPTIPGIYQVRMHEMEAYASVWNLYMPHFLGIYEGWPGFMNGFHGLPTLSSGQRLWAGYLGRPVSYGCIVLGLAEAEDLYNWAENGVVVEIQP